MGPRVLPVRRLRGGARRRLRLPAALRGQRAAARGEGAPAARGGGGAAAAAAAAGPVPLRAVRQALPARPVSQGAHHARPRRGGRRQGGGEGGADRRRRRTRRRDVRRRRPLERRAGGAGAGGAAGEGAGGRPEARAQEARPAQLRVLRQAVQPAAALGGAHPREPHVRAAVRVRPLRRRLRQLALAARPQAQPQQREAVRVHRVRQELRLLRRPLPPLEDPPEQARVPVRRVPEAVQHHQHPAHAQDREAHAAGGVEVRVRAVRPALPDPQQPGGARRAAHRRALARVPRLRQGVLQPQRAVEARGEPRRRPALPLRAVRGARVQEPRGAAPAPAHGARRRRGARERGARAEAPRVPPLPQALRARQQAAPPPLLAHGRAPVRLPALREALRRLVRPARAPAQGARPRAARRRRRGRRRAAPAPAPAPAGDAALNPNMPFLLLRIKSILYGLAFFFLAVKIGESETN